MEDRLKDIGRITICMEMEFILGLMVGYLKVNFKMIRSMYGVKVFNIIRGSVNILGQTNDIMRVNG